VVSFMPRPLYPREKNPLYPLDERLGGAQSRSGLRGEVKILSPTWTQTPTPRLSSRYTDCAIPAPNIYIYIYIYILAVCERNMH
jgi:hypothetical protein